MEETPKRINLIKKSVFDKDKPITTIIYRIERKENENESLLLGWGIIERFIYRKEKKEYHLSLVFNMRIPISEVRIIKNAFTALLKIKFTSIKWNILKSLK